MILELTDRSKLSGKHLGGPPSCSSSVEQILADKVQHHRVEKQKHHRVDELDGEDDFNMQNELYDLSRFHSEKVVSDKLSSENWKGWKPFSVCDKTKQNMPTTVVDYTMLEASKLFESILIEVSNEIAGSKDFTLADDSVILLLNWYKHLGTFENSMSPNATGINSCEASGQKDTHFIGEHSAKSSDWVKTEQKSDLPWTPNKSEKFSSMADRMMNTPFMNWVDQWKDWVAKQSICNREIREMGMMNIPDQGIGFDQEGLPYKLNNPPPHVADHLFPPLSDPNASNDHSRAKRESVPVSGFTGGGRDPPPGDSDDNGSDSESLDDSGDDRNPSSDESDDQAGSGSSNGTTSICGANPSNVNGSNSSSQDINNWRLVVEVHINLETWTSTKVEVKDALLRLPKENFGMKCVQGSCSWYYEP